MRCYHADIRLRISLDQIYHRHYQILVSLRVLFIVFSISSVLCFVILSRLHSLIIFLKSDFSGCYRVQDRDLPKIAKRTSFFIFTHKIKKQL